MAPTIVAVTSSIPTGGTSPLVETVRGTSATTPTESAAATRSFSTSGGVSAASRVVGSADTLRVSQAQQPDGPTPPCGQGAKRSAAAGSGRAPRSDGAASRPDERQAVLRSHRPSRGDRPAARDAATTPATV